MQRAETASRYRSEISFSKQNEHHTLLRDCRTTDAYSIQGAVDLVLVSLLFPFLLPQQFHH